MPFRYITAIKNKTGMAKRDSAIKVVLTNYKVYTNTNYHIWRYLLSILFLWFIYIIFSLLLLFIFIILVVYILIFLIILFSFIFRLCAEMRGTSSFNKCGGPVAVRPT